MVGAKKKIGSQGAVECVTDTFTTLWRLLWYNIQKGTMATWNIFDLYAKKRVLLRLFYRDICIYLSTAELTIVSFHLLRTCVWNITKRENGSVRGNWRKVWRKQRLLRLLFSDTNILYVFILFALMNWNRESPIWVSSRFSARTTFPKLNLLMHGFPSSCNCNSSNDVFFF